MANKDDFVRKLAKKIKQPLYKTEDIVDNTLETLLEMMLEFGSVRFHNFGTFALKTRKAKVGRIIATGEECHIPPMRYIKFEPSKRVKEIIK